MKKIDKEELHTIFIKMRDEKNSQISLLYQKYQKLLYAISFSITKNTDNSQDIVQIVFNKIWNMDIEKLPTNNEASWLYTMTKNETINFLVKEKSMVNLDELYSISDEDKQINEIIDKDAYNRIIAKLSRQEQEIVSLKILSNLSFKEISKILNIPMPTVQWKYYKSLHTLKILISNLSVFIITIGLFIANKLNKTKKSRKEEQVAINNQINASIENDTNKKEESQIADSILGNNQEEQTTQNVIVEVNQSNINKWDISILSISGIFLLFTIIFSIIFIKHQQNVKKKLSK